jgi:cytochrome d ubiquinol oxidase subunit I
MWLVHIGTVLSAYFILAANSFMQNPVGYRYNEVTGRAEMADFVAVLTNKVQLVTFPHVIAAAYMTGGALVMAVAGWHLRRIPLIRDGDRPGDRQPRHVPLRRCASAPHHADPRSVVIVTGDLQGKVMTEVQPMKMAAAEALYETSRPHAPFSVLQHRRPLDGSMATHWSSGPRPAVLPRPGQRRMPRSQGIDDLLKDDDASLRSGQGKRTEDLGDVGTRRTSPRRTGPSGS